MTRFNCDFSSRFRILKGGKISLVVSALLASTTLSFAAPSGEQIVSGNVQIDRTTPNTTNITQSTNKSIINWQNFSVAGNETVNFNMPSATSSSLNRVVGNNKSEIYGKINSNGQVFLVNQNGIYFSKDAQVNTAGFVASTRNISDENFNNSNYIFEGNSQASIINLGTITTDNAYTALLAKKVENEGVIKAHLGSVQLASGERFTLDINGNSLVKLTIDKGTLDGLVANKGAIIADGGEIYLTTSALDTVLNGLVNNTGIIQANSVEEKDGKIILFAHGGTGEFGGSIEANGGFVETSGDKVKFTDDFSIKAKDWLIDPANVTITNTTSAMTNNANTITPADGFWTTSIDVGTLTTALNAGTNVTVTTVNTSTAPLTNGNINVNAPISWSSGSGHLTLNAENNIYINEDITIGTAFNGLILKYGQGTTDGVISGTTANYYLASGKKINYTAGTGTFNTKLGSNGTQHSYVFINTDAALAGMTTNSSIANYVLATDLDLSDYNGGVWTPIGTSGSKFTGRFEGLGHTVSGAMLEEDVVGDNLGLFGYTNGATIKNLKLEDFNILAGGSNIGGLIGTAENTIVNNITLGNSEPYSFMVTGVTENVGGLIGSATGGTISNITSFASVYGDSGEDTPVTADNVGGIVGKANGTSISNATIADNVEVLGNQQVGGAIGYIENGSVSNVSVGASSVAGSINIGGLIGEGYYDTSGHTLTNLVSNASVKGSMVGGLIGALYGNDGTSLASSVVTLSKSYATGAVDGSAGSKSGGLIGEVFGLNATLEDLYATGSVANAVGTNHGGLIGYLNAQSSLTRSYATGAVNEVNGGGLIGANANTTGTNVTNSYWDITTTGRTTSKGGTGKTTAELLNKATYSGWSDTIWSFTNIVGDSSVAGYQISGSRPYLIDVTQISDRPTATSILFAGGWGGLTSTEQAGADGSAYTITTAQQLQNINYVANQNFDFVLSDDISLTGVTWTPIGDSTNKFKGTFDGGDKTISNLTVPLGTDYGSGAGLFGYTEDATIKDLTLSSVNIDAMNFNYVGALIGNSQSTTIDNVTVTSRDIAQSNDIVGNGYVGGLVGRAINTTITNSSSSASINGHDHNIGGLVGYADLSEISDSFASGEVLANSGNSNIGGLVGSFSNGTVIDSYATGNVSGGGNIGGLIGYSSTNTITNLHATGSVYGMDDNTGGLIGKDVSSTISNSYATAVGQDGDEWNGVYSEKDLVGGLIGLAEASTISQSYSTATVTGNYAVGGLIGKAYGSSLTTGRVSITDSHATGDVTAEFQIAGGLVGNMSNADLENVYATSNVIGPVAGGLVGGIADLQAAPQISNITKAYATGDVTGVGYIGGLIGHLTNTNISKTYATGDVEVGEYGLAGGLVGYAMYMPIETETYLVKNNYATGDVSSTTGSGLGGFIGGIMSDPTHVTITNNYAIGDVSGVDNVGRLIGITDSMDLGNNPWTTMDATNIYSINSILTTTPTTTTYGTGINISGFENKATFTNWDNSIWSFGGGDTVKGFEIASRPYLTTLGKDSGITSTKLFDSGFGTSDDPYTISFLDASLRNIGNASVVSGGYHYILTADIVEFNGIDWIPIGDSTNRFKGTFDGGNHTISGALLGDLVINNSSLENAGLFGYTENATIKNLTLDTISITGSGQVGALVGGALNSTIENVTVKNSMVNGTYSVGGLVGATLGNSSLINTHAVDTTVIGSQSAVGGLVGNNNGTINNSSTICTTNCTTVLDSSGVRVSGNSSVGGLAGSSQNGSIENSFSTLNVYGINYYIGGLVGYNTANVSTSYATGDVEHTGNYGEAIGGLIGYMNDKITIDESYASGDVIASKAIYVGGLVGWSYGNPFTGNGIIQNSYSSGDVTGEDTIGGLVGYVDGVDVINSYASGVVTATTTSETPSVGGLIGRASDTISSVTTSFYDKTVNPDMVDEELYGKTTKELQTLATFDENGAGWNIELDELQKKIYPYLTFEDGQAIWKVGKYSTALNYTLDTANTTYNGLDQALSSFWTNSIFGDLGSSLVYGTHYKFVFGDDYATSFKNAGTYEGITVELLNSDYELEGTPSTGILIIEKAPLTISANNAQKVYGSENPTFNVNISGFVGSETLATSGVTGSADVMSLATNSTDVGTATIYPGSGTLSASNYAFRNFSNGVLTITPKPITVSADDLTKIYGSEDATLTYTTDGLVGSDSLTGSLKRVAGENVGEYVISEDTTLANSNYTITFENGTYTITPKAITVTAENKSKTSGETDPSFTYSATGLVGSDSLSGSLIRESGESVGNYDISKGTLANSNYTIDFTNGNLEIKPNVTVAKVVETIVPKPPVVTPPPPAGGRGGKRTTTVVTTTTPSGSIAAPTVEAAAVTTLVKAAVPALSGSTSEFTLVSQANNTEVSKVTMEELALQAPNSEIRVALGGDSLVALVNGGVSLPDGISQEFYVVESK